MAAPPYAILFEGWEARTPTHIDRVPWTGKAVKYSPLSLTFPLLAPQVPRDCELYPGLPDSVVVGFVDRLGFAGLCVEDWRTSRSVVFCDRGELIRHS